MLGRPRNGEHRLLRHLRRGDQRVSRLRRGSRGRQAPRTRSGHGEQRPGLPELRGDGVGSVLRLMRSPHPGPQPVHYLQPARGAVPAGQAILGPAGIAVPADPQAGGGVLAVGPGGAAYLVERSRRRPRLNRRLPRGAPRRGRLPQPKPPPSSWSSAPQQAPPAEFRAPAPSVSSGDTGAFHLLESLFSPESAAAQAAAAPPRHRRRGSGPAGCHLGARLRPPPRPSPSPPPRSGRNRRLRSRPFLPPRPSQRPRPPAPAQTPPAAAAAAAEAEPEPARRPAAPGPCSRPRRRGPCRRLRSPGPCWSPRTAPTTTG